MASKGHPDIIVYLDDFLIVAHSKEECQKTLQVLMETVRRLGFGINYNKVAGPSQRLTFLGIMLDAVSMTMELPEEKCQEIKDLLHQVYQRRKIKKRELQSLVGKLSWASQCVQGGRTFIRRLIDPIAQLKSPWHRTRVTQDMKEDIEWWMRFLDVFNGPFSTWLGASGLHINHKETLAIETAAARWAHRSANHRVFLYCDNQAAVGIVNKGSCRDTFLMQSLHRIFWLSAKFNFRLKVIYYPGVVNVVADAVSRLHEPRGYEELYSILGGYDSSSRLNNKPGHGKTFLESVVCHPSRSSG